MAADWFAILTGAWGLAAGPLGFWIGRRDRQRDAMPNVRPIDFKAGAAGYSGIIEIQARTSEDILVTRIDAAGGMCLTGEETLEVNPDGTVVIKSYHFTPTPRPLTWRVAGNQAAQFRVKVDSLAHFRLDLTMSSSARTLVDKVISVETLHVD